MLPLRALNPGFIPHQVSVMKRAQTLRTIVFTPLYFMRRTFVHILAFFFLFHESPSYSMPEITNHSMKLFDKHRKCVDITTADTTAFIYTDQRPFL